jgi:hypothetical protein
MTGNRTDKTKGVACAGAPVVAVDWRPLEAAIVDAMRQQGCPLHNRNGTTFVLAEFHDEETGELLQRQQIVDLERLARDLAGALPWNR